MPEGGSTCQNGLGQARFKKLQVAKFRVGQHAGIAQIKLQVSGWVNITGMVGQHETEWWVNMVRNLQTTPIIYTSVFHIPDT